MNDTPESVAKMVDDRHRAMTPLERLIVASSMFETARKVVESSLPNGLTAEQRRLAIARRLYAKELPEVALLKHARFVS